MGNAALALVDQDAASLILPKVKDEAVVESRSAFEEDDDKGKDSGNESAADSDAEDKQESMKAIQNALVGMNVSQLELFLFSRQMFFLKETFHGQWCVAASYQVISLKLCH